MEILIHAILISYSLFSKLGVYLVDTVGMPGSIIAELWRQITRAELPNWKQMILWRILCNKTSLLHKEVLET